MQRYGIPVVLALVIGLAFIGFRSLGDDDAPPLLIDLQPIEVTHSTESGLTVTILNNSENAFDGDVRVQVIQANSSVTTSIRVAIFPFGLAEGEIGGEWLTGQDAPVISILLDPQEALNDSNDGNDTITVTCPLPDAKCQVEN